MGTLFNYVSGADVSLPDISVAGYDLTVDGQLNTTDYADSGVGGFIRGLSQFATGFLIPISQRLSHQPSCLPCRHW